MKRAVAVLGLGVTLAASICLSAGAENLPKQAQQGVTYFNKGYIQQALPLFEQAAKAHPQNETVHLWVARAAKKQGGTENQQKAKAAYYGALQVNPRNREALVNLGEMLSWDPAHRNEAVILLKRAYELDPNDARTGRMLAEVLYWQGQLVDSLEYAAAVSDDFANDKQWMATYAEILTRTGNARQALRIFEGPLNIHDSKDLKARQSYALALFKANQPQDALAVYDDLKNRALETGLKQDENFLQSMAGLAFDLGRYGDSAQWDSLLPDNLQREKHVQLRMARALGKAFRVPESIEKFQGLYEAGLLSTEEKLEYADYLTSLSLPPEALPSPDIVDRLFQDVLASEPGNVEVSLRLARSLGQDPARFDQAVQYYQQALAVDMRAEKELVDFLKARSKSNTAKVDAAFQQLLRQYPNSFITKGGYAEFLSWQEPRRIEAIRIFTELAGVDPANRETWQKHLDQVLLWHTPNTAHIPLYQQIVNEFPDDKAVWLVVARAYRNDPHYFTEAVDTYQSLLVKYPDDDMIRNEWLAVLVGNEKNRGEAVRMLRRIVNANPQDLDAAAAYGKLLSYERKYGEAMDVFERVLSTRPNHKEALVGKGYALLWSGQKFKAKDYLANLRTQFPDDVDVAMALAQAEKMIGRYDRALRIMEEIRPLINQYYELKYGYRKCDYQAAGSSVYGESVYDFSILPYDGPAVSSVVPPEPSLLSPPLREVMAVPEPAAIPAEIVVKRPPTGSAQSKALYSEISTLQNALQTLDALQENSQAQIQSLHETVTDSREGILTQVSMQEPANGKGVTSAFMQQGVSRHALLETGAMDQAYATYAALDYDTNPLLSGMGRFRNDDVADLRKGITNDLRPMLRAGYLFSTQDGEDTTASFRNWGFPNQIGLSLTPQIRLRGGIRPTKYYLPHSPVSPNESWGLEYAWGATVKYWDRLTLDGDMAITHFSQTDNLVITYQAEARYDFNDAVSLKLGSRRIPQLHSVLTVAGLRPDVGAFAGQVLGQARETGFYGELNTHPFSPNVDWNLGYEWAFVTGHNIPDNYKNQAFTSLGYTWHYAHHHQARFGYDLLYFGYADNATNGYFDTTAVGITRPVVSLNPVTLADPNYVFGGYFSPSWFFLNSWRLDLRGSFMNKFIEYKLGGSLGVQTYGPGNNIDEPNQTSLASSFDGNMILNLTDWLAAYGNVDFLNAGPAFERWRFGGGLILRPNIRPLSPVLGGSARNEQHP